ncbi:MAG: hypothetical protein EAZ55_01150 [Cytophagales bacterium]|nr:MAG: hypothetical protein EAZ55_01150 [Cytophagales bacterium]
MSYTLRAQSMIKADFLQRSRSYIFLMTLLVSVCFAYTFVPPMNAIYTTVRVGKYVGKPDAVWIAHATAIMASTFLWLIGFYVVSNGIKRDRDTGVGQIVATTSITNFQYLLTKTLSNFLILASIVSLIMVMAVALVFLRSESYHFDIIQFTFPYLLGVFPSIFCLSAIAVVFEVWFGRQVVLMNIGFFFLFVALLGNVNVNTNPNMFWFDALGTKFLMNNISQVVEQQFQSVNEKVNVGFIFGQKGTFQYFTYQGTTWTWAYALSRLLWIVGMLGVLFLTAFRFDRFDTPPAVVGKPKKAEKDIPKRTPLDIRLANLPTVSPAFGILPLVRTELKLLLRKGARWFWLVNLGLWVALWFIPLPFAHLFGLPALLFLQVNRWADLSTKERFHDTHYFMYAAYKPLQRVLLSQIIAGALLAVVLSLPMIVRFAFEGDILRALSIVVGAKLLVSVAVMSGIVTGGTRFFEIVFFFLTYMLVSGASVVDYLGIFQANLAYLGVQIGLLVGSLGIAFAMRRQEIQGQ